MATHGPRRGRDPASLGGPRWSVGIALFSGSLYLLAVTTSAPLWFKIAVPPLGGTALIVGWLCVGAAAWANDE